MQRQPDRRAAANDVASQKLKGGFRESGGRLDRSNVPVKNEGRHEALDRQRVSGQRSTF